VEDPSTELVVSRMGVEVAVADVTVADMTALLLLVGVVIGTTVAVVRFAVLAVLATADTDT